MSDLNPIDNLLAQTLNNYERRLQSLENARQPYIADWQSIGNLWTVVSGDTQECTIQCNDESFDYTNQFQTGNRIKVVLTRASNAYTMYFTVVRVRTNGEINLSPVNSGADYILAAGDVISYVYKSNVPTPTGYPFRISMNPQSFTLNDTGTYTDTASNIAYVINGSQIFFYGDISGSISGIGVATDVLKFKIPYFKKVDIVQFSVTGTQVISNTTADGVVSITAFDSTNGIEISMKKSGVVLSNGTFQCNFILNTLIINI